MVALCTRVYRSRRDQILSRKNWNSWSRNCISNTSTTRLTEWVPPLLSGLLQRNVPACASLQTASACARHRVAIGYGPDAEAQAARYGSRVKLMNNPSAPLRFVLVARIFIHLEGRERTLRRCAQLTEVRG